MIHEAWGVLNAAPMGRAFLQRRQRVTRPRKPRGVAYGNVSQREVFWTL